MTAPLAAPRRIDSIFEPDAPTLLAAALNASPAHQLVSSPFT
jgi:hypothetical protein